MPIRDIIRFINVASVWQQQKQTQSHLKYAISRVLPGCEKAFREHEVEMGRVSIENATCDDKGNVQFDGNGQLVFKPEAMLKRNDEHMKLQDEEDEVGVYFAKVVPTDLTPAQEQAFEGFVIPELTEPPPPPDMGVPPKVD